MDDQIELRQLLSAPKKIFITTHQKPDGDALGSSLALLIFLEKSGHKCTFASPTDYPYFLNWMPSSDRIINFESQAKQVIADVNDADLIFCLDFNDLRRCGGIGDHIAKAKGKKILIDHHLDPVGFEDYKIWNNKACSTAELVYDFFCMMEQEDLVDTDIAECIYTGIMTDTGSFRFPSTTPRAHRIAGNLIELGLDVEKIHQAIYDTFSEKRLRFFGYALHKKLKIIPELNVAYFAITAQELQDFSLGTGDTEGLVNFGLSISGIKLAAFISDRTPYGAQEKIIKLSLRSKDNVPVNEICSKYFNGGGHKNASGGQTNFTLEKTVELFEKAVQDLKDVLI